MKYDIPFKNDSGEEIPPYGVFKVSGIEMVNSRALIVADKPDTYGSQYLHFINGITAVADGKCGSCCNTFPCLAKHGTGTPAIGELWGPRDDSWVLEEQTGGFIVVGQHSSGIAIVQRMPMLAFTGRFNATVSQGSSGTVSVYWQGSDTGEDISTVYAVSDGFGTSDNVNVSWMNQRWEAYCRD